MTTEPTYKPGAWIVYELDDSSQGFGQIVGGKVQSGSWTYSVKGGDLNGESVQVPERGVRFTLENGNWSAPTNFGGSNSAYVAAEGTV